MVLAFPEELLCQASLLIFGERRIGDFIFSLISDRGLVLKNIGITYVVVLDVKLLFNSLREGESLHHLFEGTLKFGSWVTGASEIDEACVPLELVVGIKAISLLSIGHLVNILQGKNSVQVLSVGHDLLLGVLQHWSNLCDLITDICPL